MACDELTIHTRPELRDARMVLGLTGWMDGGDVSTGTVDWLVRLLGADKLAEIDPGGFTITSFPGTMDISALFRPYTRIEDGLITELTFSANVFHCDAENNLILFSGKEPNLRWDAYADCIFSLAETFGVGRITFIGSVAGVVPHTREPRLYCSVSDPGMKEEFEGYGARFSNYEGPASIVTYLTQKAPSHGMEMVALVAEIPAYVQGTNPICIASTTRRLAAILALQLDFEELRVVREAFETKLGELVADRKQLADLVGKLESDYDNEVFDTEMGDLKDWLEQKGIRLD